MIDVSLLGEMPLAQGRGQPRACGGCGLLIPTSQDLREEMRVTTYLGLDASHKGLPGHPHPVCSPSPLGSLPWCGNRNL